MGFFEDVGKALGVTWFDQRMRSDPRFKGKVEKIRASVDKNIDNIVAKYTKIDKKTGKTLAKTLYDLNHPKWQWIEKNLPPDKVNLIKQKSGIS